MKTKDEILKMTKDKILAYKWSADLNSQSSGCSRCFDCSCCSGCSDCSCCSRCYRCFNCSDCFNCFNCSDCFGCRDLFMEKSYQYMICNIQFTKEEYELKMKEINGVK